MFYGEQCVIMKKEACISCQKYYNTRVTGVNWEATVHRCSSK